MPTTPSTPSLAPTITPGEERGKWSVGSYYYPFSLNPPSTLSGAGSLFHPLFLHPDPPINSLLSFFFDSDSLLDFLEENRAYVHAQINHHYQPQQQQQQHTEEEREKGREERDYWLGAAAVLAQFEGTKSTLLASHPTSSSSVPHSYLLLFFLPSSPLFRPRRRLPGFHHPRPPCPSLFPRALPPQCLRRHF